MFVLCVVSKDNRKKNQVRMKYGQSTREYNLGGRKIFRTRPDRLLVPPRLYGTGTGFLSRGKGDRGVALPIHLHLAPRLKKE